MILNLLTVVFLGKWFGAMTLHIVFSWDGDIHIDFMIKRSRSRKWTLIYENNFPTTSITVLQVKKWSTGDLLFHLGSQCLTHSLSQKKIKIHRPPSLLYISLILNVIVGAMSFQLLRFIK